jgi:hypothetical protein
LNAAMFFKKKVTVEDFCSDYLKTLFLPEIDLVYEQLRDARVDPALSAADHKLYLDHMRAVIIELMNIAITKHCGWPIDTDAQVFIAGYLDERGLSHIDSLSSDSLTSIYNQAFGIIGQDGVASIVAAFAEQVTDSQMRPETMQRFYVEFSNTLKGFFYKLKTVKVTAAR